MPDTNGNTTQNRVIMENIADTAITRFVEQHPEMKSSKLAGSIPAWGARGVVPFPLRRLTGLEKWRGR